MIGGPKIEIFSNGPVDNVFSVVKSFTTFYFIQHHKNVFHDELFFLFILSVRWNYISRVWKKSQPNLIENLANKKRRVPEVSKRHRMIV